MRRYKRPELLRLVFPGPVEIVRRSVKPNTHGQIDVEGSELKDPLNPAWKGARLDLHPPALRIEEVVSLRTGRGQRAAVDRKRERLAYLALDASRRSRYTAAREFLPYPRVKLEQFSGREVAQVNGAHERQPTLTPPIAMTG
ncbi:hypothetical protein NQ156_01265 [Microbacterium sp. zg.Y625]|nr:MULTISPECIES: hypothetical protein [unclassified Microbacterium]MCR2791689.1 hypothetical protein [Microbacterium sp. zg.Y625]WIM24507.1 hypothetical protein QNO14_10175 [Microbacterium sp. zg-Y625]